MKNENAEMRNEYDDATMIKSDFVSGFFINNKEVETRIDRVIYKSGKVLTEVYQNNHLRVTNMAIEA